jgi:hypothetical protein
MKQHREPAGPLDESADRRAAQAEDEVAFPVAGDGPVDGFGGPLADHDLFGDEPFPAPAGAGPGDAQRPAGPQTRGQLALQRSSALDEQRLIDRLMGDAHRLIIGEVQAQPVGDLLWTPRPGPTAIPAATAAPAEPLDVRAAHRNTIGSLDHASQPVLDKAPQLVVDGKLGRLGPPRPPICMPLRGCRAIVKAAAAGGGVASQLPRDRRRRPT